MSNQTRKENKKDLQVICSFLAFNENTIHIYNLKLFIGNSITQKCAILIQARSIFFQEADTPVSLAVMAHIQHIQATHNTIVPVSI
jgi:hypothetical protein